MDSFPYDSWEEALAAAAADGDAGYFTFGRGVDGGNTAIIIITILGILLALWWTVQLTMAENKHLNERAARLNEKWGI